MIDPTLELQKAIFETLHDSTAVQALIGDVSPPRIYDKVSPTAVKPYISLGQPQVLPDKADCIDGAEVSFQVDGWAEGPQSVAIKRLGAAISGALDGVEFVLPNHRTVLCELEQMQYLDDEDGFTKHVAVTLRILTEPTD